MSKTNCISKLKNIAFCILAFIGFNAFSQSPVHTSKGYFLMDKQGEIKTSQAYEFIGKSSFNLHLAIKAGKFGYIKPNGELAIACQYDVAYPFNGPFALVGLKGKYYHINTLNKRLDSMNWPKAPSVYKNQMLLLNSDNSKVLDANGLEVLKASKELILTEKAGIIMYSGDTVFQYVLSPGNQSFKLLNTFKVVDKPIISLQGYLCVQSIINDQKKYAVYNDLGEQLILCDTKEVNPFYIYVVWDKFVNTSSNPEYSREHLLGQETHFAMNQMWEKGRHRQSPFTFNLCEKYAQDKMVLLKYTGKWARYDGNRMIGNRLYDEVLPGDETYTPVKIGDKWFILDRKQDTLIPTPYKIIHPIGMSEGRFFASTNLIGMQKSQWAFVNIRNKVSTAEAYRIHLDSYFYSVFDAGQKYLWEKDFVSVYKDEYPILLNNKGKELWVDSSGKSSNLLEYFNIDFELKADNLGNLSKKHGLNTNNLALILKPSQNGIEVIFANPQNSVENIEVQDNYFMAFLQLKNDAGIWENRAFLTPSTCGNSYYSFSFPPNKFAKTSIHLPPGNNLLSFRVVINPFAEKPIFSNVIEVKTNAGKLWVKKYCEDFGCSRQNKY